MGVLQTYIDEYSNGDVVGYFKRNSERLYTKYRYPDRKIDGLPSGKGGYINPIPVKNMAEGRFYFLVYQDVSKWMMYSPIFFVDFKKFNNKIIAYGINLNFLPLDFRSGFFDKFINNLEDNYQLKGVNFEETYRELLKIGFEYSIMEYDLSRVGMCYEIDIQILPMFLYSTYPEVKYNPEKLYEIWSSKLKDKEQRHQEIITQLASDFYEATDEIKEKYDSLSGRLKRIQDGMKKFG